MMNRYETKIADSLGNLDLLKRPRTAFLCSRRIPASVILKCYDWAIGQRESGNCVISGFHSKIEKDVFHYLLAGSQPIIIVLARGMKDRFEADIKSAVESGRLLIVTPFEKHIKRTTEITARIRNQLMVELANEIAIGHVSKGGMLENLLNKIKSKKVYKI